MKTKGRPPYLTELSMCKLTRAIQKRDLMQNSLTKSEIRDMVVEMKRQEVAAEGKNPFAVKSPSRSTLVAIMKIITPDEVANAKDQTQRRLEV